MKNQKIYGKISLKSILILDALLRVYVMVLIYTCTEYKFTGHKWKVFKIEKKMSSL